LRRTRYLDGKDGHMSIGECCPVDIQSDRPFVVLIDGPKFDPRGYQRATRINGGVWCPRCGLWLPSVEDIEAWIESDDGRWLANEWGLGIAWCDQCEIAIVDGFDTSYVISDTNGR